MIQTAIIDDFIEHRSQTAAVESIGGEFIDNDVLHNDPSSSISEVNGTGAGINTASRSGTKARRNNRRIIRDPKEMKADPNICTQVLLNYSIHSFRMNFIL
jgi:hypothetical protein